MWDASEALSRRVWAARTGSRAAGKTRALASVEPLPRGALGASARDAPALELLRHETRRSADLHAARVLRRARPISSSRVTQGATATTALSAPQTVGIMVKQRRRSAAAVGFQNIEVVPSEALESALRERQQLCKHGEAWARRIGASDDPQKLKAFTGLWWDLSPQMRSWDVPPDDGSKCQKCNIAASRRGEAPSLHCHESSPGMMDVGGFFFDFGAVRTEPRCSAQVKGRIGWVSTAGSRIAIDVNVIKEGGRSPTSGSYLVMNVIRGVYGNGN